MLGIKTYHLYELNREKIEKIRVEKQLTLNTSTFLKNYLYYIYTLTTSAQQPLSQTPSTTPSNSGANCLGLIVGVFILNFFLLLPVLLGVPVFCIFLFVDFCGLR